ncbi:N-ethylmaleimide reductase [Thalassoglobus neptunius]|uniref:N-ethylmaleimide reductase n=1 Tax=Thalassoglobus neptunius TaxID=1938619 RepID=A0A5C5VAW0_9PLAN|nr:alkene reductase [Thalassoglobus neptunius]TWT35087.1 N-ethylmaleimide reductase [Thalassoglobus neptunius]
MSTISPQLLAPIELRDLKLKNRIALAPMTRARAGAERIPNSLMAEYYVQRASAGLVITEGTHISEQAIGWSGSPGIYTEAMRKGWRNVVDAVHQAGGTIFMQLWHCGRSSHSSYHGGKLAVAPSAIAINEEYIHTPNGKQPHEVPRALEASEMAGIVADYRNAAKAAIEAGFDGVEIHSANGYLLDSFLQSKTNQRTDDYGGGVENRYRLLDEVVTATCEVCPANRVGVRLSPNGVYNDMGSPDFREQFTYTAEQLDKFGLAYLHVMDGLAFGFHELGEPMTLSDFHKVFTGPLMGNCGYTQQTAEQTIVDGHADMVSFGRPFISNPDLVRRFADGLELNPDSHVSTWYTTAGPDGAKGYTDFPVTE